MRHYIMIFLLMLSLPSWAQTAQEEDDKATVQEQNESEEERNLRFEIGLNATGFVKQFVPGGNDFFVFSQPYLLQSKLLFKKRQAIRFGANYNRSEIRNPDPVVSSVSVNSSAALRLGFEFHKAFGKRWSAFYGADVIGGQVLSRSTTSSDPFLGEVTVENETLQIGGGPVVGIQVVLNKHIRLYTESMFYFQRDVTEQHTDFGSPFIEDNTEKFRSQTFNLIPPSSLFLAFTF